MIALRCGADDADVLERAFNHEYRAHQFTDLDRFEVYIKTIVDGELEVLRASTIAPTIYTHRRRDTLLKVSRRKYGRDREAVEREINSTSFNSYIQKAPRRKKAKGLRGETN